MLEQESQTFCPDGPNYKFRYFIRPQNTPVYTLLVQIFLYGRLDQGRRKNTEDQKKIFVFLSVQQCNHPVLLTNFWAQFNNAVGRR